MSDILRIAVASDLHAHSMKDGEAPSHLDVSDPATLPNQNPLAGLKKLISEQGLEATALLSPGDLGHQANPIAIQYAWRELHEVGKTLGAKLTTATAGNHDIDSRYAGDDHSPEHILKGLIPNYPLADERLCDRYWARAYALLDLDEFRLLLLNSSAYHGNTPTEQNHGRIDKQTLEDIRRDLGKRGKREINVMLCHHHPHQHSELNLGEHDVMKQGQLLLDLLGTGDHGSWLVIHGHKHHPKLSYAAGGAASPIVFAAGSFSSKLFLPLQTVARNQFYMIEIDPKEVKRFGLVGRIRAWDWSVGPGWVPAEEGSGLSACSGFGVRMSPAAVATRIAEIVGSSKDALPWAEIVTRFPEIEFLLPQDFKQAEKILLTLHGLRILRYGGSAAQIGRIV